MSASDHRDRLDPRGTVDLVGHTVVPASDVAGVVPDNFVRRAKTERGRWVQELTEMIGPTRATFRSTYFHWAMAINGLAVAAARYDDPEWQASHAAFTISGLRTTGRYAEKVSLAEWSGPRAAAAHIATQPKMAAWGYIELFSALESFVFAFYRSYLTHHPESLIRGAAFKELRKLRAAAQRDPSRLEEWQAELAARLDAWHRKRGYDGIQVVLLAFFSTTSLKAPAKYKLTSPVTWSETAHALALARHLLVHGATLVTQELGDLCARPHTLSLGFKAGEPLVLGLPHLQAFELFGHQLLDAINLSLLEHPDART